MAASPLFNKVQIKEPPRSRFDLSHEVKMSVNMGDLNVFLCEECIPGDKFELSSEVFVRLQPLLAPIMHRANVTVHYFFIPNRLLWNDPTSETDNWETFITAGEDGTAEPTPPCYHLETPISAFNRTDLGMIFAEFGGLPDQLGVNIQNLFDSPGDLTMVDCIISALPFRAYAQVFNDYYRDQNLRDKIEFTKSGGILDENDMTADDFATCQLWQRCWEKDYFTSALPWVQRGDPMAIPFRPINSDVYFSRAGITDDRGSFWLDKNGDSSGGTWAGDVPSVHLVDDDGRALGSVASGASTVNAAGFNAVNVYYDPNGSLNVPFLQNAATIQDLRIASKIQRWEEAHALSGARYNEQIMTDFFTKVPDYRLQRAEYLGGGVQPVVINEVLQTSETNTTALGSMAGQGISAGSSNKCYYYVQEHGFIMGILSILPQPAYFQGLSKMWTRFDRFDYAFPRLQGIGEQPVYRRELLFRGINNPDNIAYSNVGDDEVFGYQGQNADYKFHFDRVSGDFKKSLDFWHMARKFTYENKATLNEAFVTFDETQICDPFAVALGTGVNHFLCDIYIHEKASRYLPFWSDPKLN